MKEQRNSVTKTVLTIIVIVGMAVIVSYAIEFISYMAALVGGLVG